MKNFLINNIVTFIFFSAILVGHFMSENTLTDLAIYKRDINICSQAERQYFENLCYKNYCQFKKVDSCKESKKSNNIIIIIDIILLWFFAQLSLGKAYYNFLERFINLKVVRGYRSFQEDEMYFFFRLIAGIVIYLLFYFYEFDFINYLYETIIKEEHESFAVVRYSGKS